MRKNNDNAWNTRKVAEAHGYFSKLDQTSPVNEIFASFVRDKDDARIFDIGCGNGRVVNSLDRYSYSKYLGIDACEEVIAVAEEHFEGNDKVSFLAMDIDKDIWPEMISDYNIAYFGSTFEMMQNPISLLKRITETFETVFFTRLRLFDLEGGKAEKTSFRWLGMEEKSTLWRLDESFLGKFSSSYGGEFKIINAEEHGVVPDTGSDKPVATCTVLYER